MIQIFRKEFNAFFNSLTGYAVITFFLVVTGMFMWIFRDTGIIYTPFASLDPFFELVPVVLLFLVPAITMKSFSEEFQNGTIELLATKPIHSYQIILGKFIANALLVTLAVVPTLLYYFTIYQLSDPPGNVDHGAIIGSYIGLVFLAVTFTSMGIFASSLSDHQISGFLLAVLFIFIMHWGFYYASNTPFVPISLEYSLQKWGMQYHYEQISKGFLDSKSSIYFISVAWLFLQMTVWVVQYRQK